MEIMERKTKGRYFIAFVITTMVFVIGFLIGLVVENKRIAYIEKEFIKEKLELKSSQILQKLLESFKDKSNCEILIKHYYRSLEKLGKLGSRLEYYEKENKISSEEFKVLKREYLLEQINYWLTANKIKKLCNAKWVTLIYVYSTKEECPTCEDLTFILTYLKKKFNKKLLIFSIDSKLKDNAINLLLEKFNVTVYPTVIIDENIKIEGLKEKNVYEKYIKECLEKKGEEK